MRSLLRTVSLRYWRRHLDRAVLVVASIALGVATWVATSLLNDSVQESSRGAAVPLAGGADLHVASGDMGVPRDLVDELQKVPGVREVRALVIHKAVLPGSEPRSVLILGIDLPPESSDVTIHAAETSSFGGLMMGYKPALVGRELDQLLPPGSPRFNVLVAGKPYRFTRAGIVTDAKGPLASLAGRVVVLPCGVAAELLGRPDLATRLDVTLDNDANRERVRSQIEARLGEAGRVWTPDGYDQRTQDMIAGLRIAFSLSGAGALVVGLFLIANVLAVSVAERRREIGLLRCVGATRGQVRMLFLAETLVFGALGVALGLPLGQLLANYSLAPMGRLVSDVFMPLSTGQASLGVGTAVSAVFVGLGVALLSGLLPAMQAAAEEPAHASRRLPARRGAHAGWRLGAVVLLTGIGCGMLFFRDLLPGRTGTVGGLVLVLIAALLAIPSLAALLAAAVRPILGRWFGIVWQLAADNLGRAVARTGFVIAALAAGVCLQMFTGGLLRSNEAAVRAWIDDCIAGDLFITSGGPLSASGQLLSMHEGLSRPLADCLPGAKFVPMRFRHLDWPHEGRNRRVLLLAMDAAAYHEANADRQPPLRHLDLFRKLATPGTALVSDNFAARYRVKVGDTIRLPGAGEAVSLRVVGTVADYSCMDGVVMVDRSQLGRAFDAEQVDVFDVYLPTGTDPEAARQRVLQAPFSADLTLAALTKGELRRHILGMVDRLYGLAYTQEVVIGIVAVLGVVAAMLISVLQRRRELGLLRAVGATRGQVFASVLAEAVLLGAVGVFLGIVLSVPLLWFAVRVVLFEESGFLFPVRFAWPMALSVTALAVTCSVLAGLGPAWRSIRTDVTSSIGAD